MAANDPVQPTPPDPRSGQRGDSDAALDHALTQAATLASALSESVGQTTPTSAASPDGPKQPDLYLPPRELSDLDRELAGLDHKLSEAVAQVGSAEPHVETPARPTQRPAAVVPDFMSELTQPAEPASRPPLSPAPARPRAAPTAPAKTAPPLAGSPVTDSAKQAQPKAEKPDLSGSTARGIVGNIPKSITLRLQGAPHGFEAGKEDAVAPARPSFAHRLRNSAISLADKGVKLLEVADRPFNSLGPTLKRLLGWIAIATMATSIAVLAAALTSD